MKKLLALLTVILAVSPGSAMAGEGVHLIKGSKSYQAVDKRQSDDAAHVWQQAPQDPSQVEPAAGTERSTVETGLNAPVEEKPLHEQMRLPRKGL